MPTPPVEIPGIAAEAFPDVTRAAPNFIEGLDQMNPLEARPAVLGATKEQLLAFAGTLGIAGLVVAGVYTIINGRTPWQKKGQPTMLA